MATRELESAFISERSRLLRWMTKLTGDVSTADDLVQETFAEAWKNRQKLHEPGGVTCWLNAIAHNIYKRWARKQGQRHSRETALLNTVEDPLTEYELERGELAELLDTALAMLPPQTRTILLARYLEEQPEAKIARDMGISEGALAVRLHRGRMALHKVLDAEQGMLVDPDGWQETRIWCVNCGKGQYRARFDSQAGDLKLICPNCTTDSNFPAWASGASDEALLVGFKAIKPALKRLMESHNRLFRSALTKDTIACPSCGAPVHIKRRLPDFLPTAAWQLGAHIGCQACGLLNYTALSGVVASLPQALRFSQNHPRTQILPPQHLHYEDRPAVRIRLDSLRSGDHLDVLFASDTFDILSIYRNGKPDDAV